ncbi:hypothetical protein AC1031_018493 [Aphanomyces cochlioides]|nr:hypothetical protein AC1031_018493 [Aphanomyces cochlioides]
MKSWSARFVKIGYGGWNHSKMCLTGPALKRKSIYIRATTRNYCEPQVCVDLVVFVLDMVVAIQRVAKAIKAEKWRDEAYGARRLDSMTEPWFRVDRSASTFFGISQFGCHLNGFVRHSAHPHDLSIWLAVRDPSKAIDPGKLDSLVGGGLPWGVSPRENMLKECEEEAGFHRDQLAQDMISTGVLTWVSDEPYGLKFNTMHVYDVALPPSWTPLNQDGEVASFKLWSVDEVLDALQTSPDDFKPDICLLLIDFFIRHGILTPESCNDYVSLCSELHAQAPF